MKRLYTFTINKQEEVEERVAEKDAVTGEEKTVIKKVKKDVPKVFFLAKPTRNQIDSAEIFYGATVAEGVRKGLMNHALLSKRFSDDGGTMSEGERNKYANLFKELFAATERAEKLQAINKDNRTEAEQKELDEILLNQAEIQKEIQQIEINQMGLFEQTAEALARRKTLLWWIMNISYQEQNGKEVPLFGNGTLDERLAIYDDLLEKSDEIINEAIRRISVYVPFWYVGRAEKTEDFDKIDINA